MVEFAKDVISIKTCDVYPAARYSDSGVVYSMLDKERTRTLSHFLTCKAYLEDLTNYKISNSPFGSLNCPKCYSHVENLGISDSSFDIVLVKNNTLQDANVLNIVSLLNKVEKILKLKRTVVHKLIEQNNSELYLLEGSRRWRIALPMVSFYTLLIRIGANFEQELSVEEFFKKVIDSKVKLPNYGDSNSLNQAKKGIDYILKHGYYRIFSKNIKDETQNYKRISSAGGSHNCGIIAFSTNLGLEYAMRREIPEWFKLTKKKSST